MSSENKKKKLKNSYQVPSGLKNKDSGIKKLSFYTASERKKNNLNELLDECDEDPADDLYWMNKDY